jgi:lysophospholipase L1-like esterase
VVVYAGDNDLADGRTPAEVHAAYRRLASLLRERLPGARLVVVAIKPSSRSRDGRPRGDLFGGDGLHMNAAGYALWRSLLAPVLARDARRSPA